MKILLAILSLAALLFAAEPFDATTQVIGSSAAVSADFNVFVVDTLAIKPAGGTYTYKFVTPIWNLFVTVTNIAGDSGYGTVKVKGNVVGIKNSTTVAEGLASYDFWRTDTVKFYFPVYELALNANKGGNADSTASIKLWGYRK